MANTGLVVGELNTNNLYSSLIILEFRFAASLQAFFIKFRITMEQSNGFPIYYVRF